MNWKFSTNNVDLVTFESRIRNMWAIIILASSLAFVFGYFSLVYKNEQQYFLAIPVIIFGVLNRYLDSCSEKLYGRLNNEAQLQVGKLNKIVSVSNKIFYLTASFQVIAIVIFWSGLASWISNFLKVSAY